MPYAWLGESSGNTSQGRSGGAKHCQLSLMMSSTGRRCARLSVISDLHASYSTLMENKPESGLGNIEIAFSNQWNMLPTHDKVFTDYHHISPSTFLIRKGDSFTQPNNSSRSLRLHQYDLIFKAFQAQ